MQIKESFPGRAIFCFLSKSEKEIVSKIVSNPSDFKFDSLVKVKAMKNFIL